MPEVQVAALGFLPHLPPRLVVDALLDRGDIAALVAPATRSPVPSVRAAATACLAAVLLLPDVQAAMAATPALVATADEWWGAVTDGLADPAADVILAALAATNKLFEAAAEAARGATALRASAARAALHVSLVMGPLIDTWRMLPSHAQVAVASLMGHIATAVIQLDPSRHPQSGGGGIGGSFGGADADGLSGGGAGAGALGVDASGLGGSLSAALGGVVSYLASALSSLNPAVKLEAARVLLRLSSAGRALPPLSATRVAAAVPPSVAASAVAALLELKERALVEAALSEVIGLVAGHLDALPPALRADVLRRLWPMIALLQSPTDRMAAFATGWRTALEMHLEAAAAVADGRGAPQDALLLPALLADPFVQDVISARAAPPVASGAGTGALLPGAAAAGGAGGDGVLLSPSGARPSLDAGASFGGGGIAAGPTGGSFAGNPAAAGPTGASVSSTVPSSREPSTAGGLDSVPATPSGALQSAAKTVGDTLAGAAYSAADLARGAGISLPRFLDAPLAASRGQLPASLKQEMVCALLGVLARHASAGLALQLPAGEPVEPPAAKEEEEEAAKAQAKGAGSSALSKGAQPPASPKPDVPGNEPSLGLPSPTAFSALPPSSPPPLPALPPVQVPPPQLPLHPNAAAHGETQERAVLWLDAVVAALQATAGCLHWEPLLPPPLPGQPPAPRLPAVEAVNLATVPADLWLQLLQGACAASRAVLRAHGHAGLKAVYRANAGRMLARLTAFDVNGALARALEAAAVALQALVQRALAGWRSLALATRPRALWVAAHYLELPAALEDTWAALLACLEDTLLRVWRLEGDAHARLLAASARDGVLARRAALPQLGGGAAAPGGGGSSKAAAAAQSQFDAAAASALVELPEYRADGLAAALCVLQYLAWTVQAAAAAAGARRGGATAHAGPAEAALARRLLDVVKAAGAAEATGADLKEWTRRMARALAAAAEQDGGNAAGGARAGAGGPAFTVAAPAAPAAGKLPGGYNAVAGFNALGFGGGGSSSDDDSDSDSDGGSDSDSDAAGSSSDSDGSKGNSGSGSERDSSSGSSSDAGGNNDSGSSSDAPAEEAVKSPRSAARARRKAERAREREAVARANLTVGNPEASSGAWGYPFTGPRARTLFISRRSRRHRLMRWHLAAALAASEAEATAGPGGEHEAPGGTAAGGRALTFAAVGATDDTGPVFGADSGFRLDSRAFWDGLLPGSGATSPWQELSGPSDPLVISGRYTVAARGGAEQLLVDLRAANRLALDVAGAEVAVRVVGPVRPERREASWPLPPLLPTEAAEHTLKLTPTGYGRIEVHARLVLPVGGGAAAPALRCRPLVVGLARTLRVPRGLVPGPHGFLEAWASMPVGAELPVVAAWPGTDGMLLVLSALARQPLHCAWRRALPGVCGAQAAYVTAPAAAPSESLALVVTLQLMPPPGWGAGAADDATARDQGSGSDSDGGSSKAGSSGGDEDEDEAEESDGGGGGKRNSSSKKKAAAAAAPSPVEAARALVAGMRAVGHVAVRSTSHEAALAVRDHAAAWVEDVSAGALALGTRPPRAPPSARPLLHPSVARLARCLQAAAPAAPAPPQVPDLELPPPPKLQRRLRDKRQEEDSDAEDEALPLDDDERRERERALREHRAECRRLRARHAAARADRAAAVLERAALAEWRRLSLAGGGGGGGGGAV